MWPLYFCRFLHTKEPWATPTNVSTSDEKVSFRRERALDLNIIDFGGHEAPLGRFFGPEKDADRSKAGQAKGGGTPRQGLIIF